MMTVKIERRRILKPYLGGWRHKITRVEYLNATSQTGPLSKGERKNTCSKAIQCVETNERVTQSLRHRATQMWRENYYVPNETDKYFSVKSYDLRFNLDRYACVIQRNFRAYKWRKYIRQCAQVYRDIVEKCKKYEEEKVIANKLWRKQNILRQIHPQSRADFDMLYSLIEEWRMDRFKDTKSLFKACQLDEGYRILKQTVDMFNHIDKHKQEIKKLYREQKVLRFLTVNCKSRKWTGYKGKLVEMITIKIQIARKFKEIYDALNNCNVTSEQRIKLLTTLKKLIEMHNCVEAVDLLSLLDQEITLLNRKIKGSSLDYLKGRITYTYLNFIKIYGKCGCKCITRNSKNYELHEPLKAETKFCRSCLKLLPVNRFSLYNEMNKRAICNSCDSLSRRSIANVDYDPYVFILNCVQVDEECRGNTLVLLMQKQDMYYLISSIWQDQSAVSKTKDLSILRMVRYHKDIKWTPWNCILLTKDEIDVHYSVNDLTTIYSKSLINRINLRHQTARNYFKELMMFEKTFWESCSNSSYIRDELKCKGKKIS